MIFYLLVFVFLFNKNFSFGVQDLSVSEKGGVNPAPSVNKEGMGLVSILLASLDTLFRSEHSFLKEKLPLALFILLV